MTWASDGAACPGPSGAPRRERSLVDGVRRGVVDGPLSAPDDLRVAGVRLQLEPAASVARDPEPARARTAAEPALPSSAPEGKSLFVKVTRAVTPAGFGAASASCTASASGFAGGASDVPEPAAPPLRRCPRSRSRPRQREPSRGFDPTRCGAASHPEPRPGCCWRACVKPRLSPRLHQATAWSAAFFGVVEAPLPRRELRLGDMVSRGGSTRTCFGASDSRPGAAAADSGRRRAKRRRRGIVPVSASATSGDVLRLAPGSGSTRAPGLRLGLGLGDRHRLRLRLGNRRWLWLWLWLRLGHRHGLRLGLGLDNGLGLGRIERRRFLLGCGSTSAPPPTTSSSSASAAMTLAPRVPGGSWPTVPSRRPRRPRRRAPRPPPADRGPARATARRSSADLHPEPGRRPAAEPALESVSRAPAAAAQTRRTAPPPESASRHGVRARRPTRREGRAMPHRP